MLYTLNLYSGIFQLLLNKTKKIKQKSKQTNKKAAAREAVQGWKEVGKIPRLLPFPTLQSVSYSACHLLDLAGHQLKRNQYRRDWPTYDSESEYR